MKTLRFREIFFLIALLLPLTIQGANANKLEEFVQASKAFMLEGHVFKNESKQLLDNTVEVQNVLIELEKDLSDTHKVTTNLKKLDKGLQTIRTILKGVSVVPQIRQKVETLIQQIDKVITPVHSAKMAMVNVDKVVQPMLTTTQKAVKANGKIIHAEEKLRHGNLLYIQKVQKATSCLKNEFMIHVLNKSRFNYNIVDQNLKQVNTAYAQAKRVPEELIHRVMNELRALLKVDGLLHQITAKLENLYHPLNHLNYLLKQKVSINLPYICGVKTCVKRHSYPCGVKICNHRVSYDCLKTCKKHTIFGETTYPCGTKKCYKNVDYPCGTKMCEKDMKYHCGTKTCHVSIALSVEDILHGVDAIEAKIQSLISDIAWKSLKKVGLKSYIKELQDKANALLEDALRQLHLDINLDIPNIPTLHVEELKQLVNALENFMKQIETLDAKIDLKALLPQQNYLELKQFYIDLDKKLPECLKKYGVTK